MNIAWNEEPADCIGDGRGALVRALRERLGRAARLAGGAVVFSTGAAAVDRLLAGGGLQHGMLVEWLDESGGGRAATLGLLSAREACREGGVLVVLDRAGTFYPPAAVGWGVDPARLLVVRPRSARDELWAAVQALRSPVVAAVWAMIDRLASRDFRRLQLAAEAGRTLGVLVRPAAARNQPSWAEVRLGVEGPSSVLPGRSRDCNGLRTTDHGRFLRVRALRVHGGRDGGEALLEVDDAAHAVREAVVSHVTHPLPVVAELANPTAHARPAGA